MRRFILALLLLVFWASAIVAPIAGCKFLEQVDSVIPDVEACLYLPGGRKVCAVKVDGKWRLMSDLSAEERAEAMGVLERSH